METNQGRCDLQRRLPEDLPTISVEEQIDRYTHGLKAHIWKELCTKDYTVLADAMRDPCVARRKRLSPVLRHLEMDKVQSRWKLEM